ncbi:MAG: secretin N-terminal domain-containing protein [Pirellulaceae bacterium]
MSRVMWRLLPVVVTVVGLTMRAVPAQEQTTPTTEGPKLENKESPDTESAKKTEPNKKEEVKGQEGPDADKPKSQADAKSKDDESVASLKRPEMPPRIPDPREFDAAPDPNGLVRFNFYGQAWPDVLQWLANISAFSLDWQELPKDYVNISTSRNQTVPEVRDLFNRLLLDRGYTMIEQGRVLSVVRISKLDSSLLPRVEDESELMDLPPHNFVKFTFKLPDQLTAEKLAIDVKPLLSPNARITPLLATNRLLVIDAVVNLREVSQLVNAEHAAATGRALPKEFVIRYARAGQVADQVMILLGLDPRSRRTPQELQVEQQRLQLFQQMQQQGKDITKYLHKDDSPAVFLAVDERNNSVLANAPPTEMRIIEQAIEQLDVPSTSATGAMAGILSMEKYQLVTISPQSVVTALEEIGDLDPLTRLKIDTDAKIVFAHATSRDHGKIQAMIDRLDGTGRQLEVIWLRRLPADSVAITLRNLLIGEEEKEETSGRRSFYYSPSSRDEQPKKPEPGFRVDADLERNRLLLWANESELQEVRKFLEKLGEIPGRSGNPNTVRFLSPRSNEDILRTLDELRRAWKGRNRLRIESPASEPEPARRAEEAPAADSPRPDPHMAALTVDPRAAQRAAMTLEHLASTGEGGQASPPSTLESPPFTPESVDGFPDRATDPPPPGSLPPNDGPITITATPDGRIMLQSDDTAALDEIEDLIASFTPPSPDFKVFHLKYAAASMVALNLKEYFQEEKQFDTEENWMRAYYGFDFEATTKSGGGLGQRQKIRFIYDYDTNSLLVADASPAQLNVVQTLIDLYDVPPSEDSLSARQFEMFPLKYSQAEDVAATIKEVFRDLLSSKDKDFETRGGEKQENSQSRSFYRIIGSSTSDEQKPTKVRASFEGALSVGVDKIANAVIVSAQEEWMPTISQMIEFLDRGAMPQTMVTIHKVPGNIDSTILHQALQDIVSEAWVGNRRPRPQAQTPTVPLARENPPSPPKASPTAGGEASAD